MWVKMKADISKVWDKRKKEKEPKIAKQGKRPIAKKKA